MSFFKPSLYSLETARRVALLRDERDHEPPDDMRRWLDDQDTGDAYAKMWQTAIDEKGDDGE